MWLDDELVCGFKLVANVVRGGMWQFVNDTNRPAFLERDLVGLSVNGNWQVWVQYYGSEAVSIHMIWKGKAGFSDLKGITLSTLKLEAWEVMGQVRLVQELVSWRDGEWDKTCIGVYSRVGSLWGWQVYGVETHVNNYVNFQMFRMH